MDPVGSPVMVDLIQQDLVCAKLFWINQQNLGVRVGSEKDDILLGTDFSSLRILFTFFYVFWS